MGSPRLLRRRETVQHLQTRKTNRNKVMLELEYLCFLDSFICQRKRKRIRKERERLMKVEKLDSWFLFGWTKILSFFSFSALKELLRFQSRIPGIFLFLVSVSNTRDCSPAFSHLSKVFFILFPLLEITTLFAHEQESLSTIFLVWIQWSPFSRLEPLSWWTC